MALFPLDCPKWLAVDDAVAAVRKHFRAVDTERTTRGSVVIFAAVDLVETGQESDHLPRRCDYSSHQFVRSPGWCKTDQ